MHLILLVWLVALILHARRWVLLPLLADGATAIVRRCRRPTGVSPEIIAIAIGSGAIGCTIVTDFVLAG